MGLEIAQKMTKLGFFAAGSSKVRQAASPNALQCGSMTLPIVFEADAKSSLEILDQAWADEPTFAFVPDKLNIDPEWLAGALATLPDAFRTGHFALLTSGSTGSPKLVVGDRRRAEALARLLDEVQKGSDARRTVVALPLTYCFAFVNQYLWARVNQREIRLTGGFGAPDALANELGEAREAMLCLVGAQVPLLPHLGPEPFPGIVRLHFAGGRFPQERLCDVERVFPNALVFNNYGCAEAMPRLALRLASDSHDAAHIGRPLPGVELSSAEDDSLRFRSPYAARGFFEEGRWSVLREDPWIETGDLGRQLSDGTWMLTGRHSEVFKRYGEKISLPLLLDSVSRTWKGEAALFRETDSNGEEGCVLVLAPEPEEGACRSILREFRQRFSRVHWPLRIEGTDRMPRLANGKIDAVALAGSEGRTTHWRQRI